MQKKRRSLAVALLVIYLVAAATLFLWPRGGGLHRVHLDIWLVLRTWGMSASISPDATEFVLNMLVFLIGALLLAAVFPTVRIRYWVAAGVLISLGIEVAQGTLLPERNMDWVDVAANSLGAVVGGVLVRMVRHKHQAEPRLPWDIGAA